MKLLLFALGSFAAFAVAFSVVLNILASDERTDCTKVRDPAPGAWQAGDFEVRDRIVGDLSLCERLQGRTQDEVEALLGPPTQARPGELRYGLPAGGIDGNTWVLYFDRNGRVADTRYVVPTGF
ncbi:MAG: hypothetical protein H0U25_12285 [Thermoleophilaceae bacterium]|nr:hypothetical protein [Thermoleophilaceae bacterium]